MKFKIIDNFVVKHMQLGNLYIKEKNKSIVIFLFFIIFLILNQGKVHAVLQANGNDGTKYNLSDWMLNVRRMEELGGAMGLSETVNDNLTSSSGSNNIDVHMQKNTEYGALAILSASSYGNPSKVENGNTTTGNVTGVVMKFNSEWTAATANGELSNFIKRYRNDYPSVYTAKIGDAMNETLKWHGSTSYWNPEEKKTGITRNFNNSIFSYSAVYWSHGWGGTDDTNAITVKYFTRAVVVQGESF